MKIWEIISNVGIAQDELAVTKKRERLTNRMIFIGLCITIPYYPLFISQNALLPLIQVMGLTILMGSLFLFSAKGKHQLAAILLCLVVIAHLVAVSIVIEGGTGRLYLIPVSILGFTLIKSIRIGVILFSVALVAFFVAHFAPNFIDPIVPKKKDASEIVFIINMLLIFFGTLYFILQLKNTNRTYEEDILKQKEHIQVQHKELQNSHRDIQDSIRYAKRIQLALLPPLHLIEKLLPNSFVLYKPKDIVAGDFYWLEQKGDKVFFAAADCTGHGVPGAMVSVICNNALNRTVREHNIHKAGEILDTTRDIVVQAFQQSDDDVRDGMDIALCVLEGNKIQFSGANNPAWIIRQGEIIILKADKQPVGKFETSKPYSTEEFDLQKGDTLYLFSDGYADQFGGEFGKKFKLKNFMDLLLSIQHKTMSEQNDLLDGHFEKWRGDFEQLDDVCVIGVRF